MPLTRTGLMIIRAWIEEGSTKPLRAHIRLTADLSNGFAREFTLADVNSVGEIVDQWLQTILDEEAASA